MYIIHLKRNVIFLLPRAAGGGRRGEGRRGWGLFKLFWKKTPFFNKLFGNKAPRFSKCVRNRLRSFLKKLCFFKIFEKSPIPAAPARRPGQRGGLPWGAGGAAGMGRFQTILKTHTPFFKTNRKSAQAIFFKIAHNPFFQSFRIS